MYVDGFVLPVPKNKLKAYKAMATSGAKTWKKFGALDYKECVLEDAKGAFGLRFAKLAKAKPGETVVFAYIVFKSRKHRDTVNAKVMKHFEKQFAGHENDPMPFDPKRMAYDGFEVMVG